MLNCKEFGENKLKNNRITAKLVDKTSYYTMVSVLKF